MENPGAWGGRNWLHPVTQKFPPFKAANDKNDSSNNRVFPKHLLHAHFTTLIHPMFTASLEVETIISVLQLRRLRHKVAKSLAQNQSERLK